MPIKPAVIRAGARWQYMFYCWLVRNVWKTFATLEAKGLENIPATGPCIVISNHTSYLDPLFLHALVPRPLHAMAKSTQFASPFMGWLLGHIYVFPVRRYQVDPQAVRTVLRRLAGGHAVMVYVEGERSWDGRLQSPRLGILRLLMKAGVPVIPCRIDGSYDVWPRWDRKMKPGPVTLTFGKPLAIPPTSTRADRQRVMPQVLEMVRDALSGPLDEGILARPADVEPRRTQSVLRG
jgi:1-acyl-sn-glycerol-3-phosphate acyltransferase